MMYKDRGRNRTYRVFQCRFRSAFLFTLLMGFLLRMKDDRANRHQYVSI